MKIKDLLDEKGLLDSISVDIEEQMCAKINFFIIDLIIKQNNIDIYSFIQKLASLLTNENQKSLVASINNIYFNNNLDKIVSSSGVELNQQKIKEQLSKTMEIKLSENLKNQISESIKNSLSSEIVENGDLSKKITEKIATDLKEQIKEQLSGHFSESEQKDNLTKESNADFKKDYSYKEPERQFDKPNFETLLSEKLKKSLAPELDKKHTKQDYAYEPQQRFDIPQQTISKQNEISNIQSSSSSNITNNFPDNIPTRTIIQTIQQVGAVNLLPDGTPDYTIDESGTALGITIGRTTRMEVINIMKNFSKSTNNQALAKLFSYDDVGLIVTFNEQKIVKGLTFGKNYKGSTSMGLKIGDKLEKAIEIYGAPQYKTAYNAVWKEMALFCEEANIISSIRLQV